MSIQLLSVLVLSTLFSFGVLLSSNLAWSTVCYMFLQFSLAGFFMLLGMEYLAILQIVFGVSAAYLLLVFTLKTPNNLKSPNRISYKAVIMCVVSFLVTGAFGYVLYREFLKEIDFSFNYFPQEAELLVGFTNKNIMVFELVGVSFFIVAFVVLLGIKRYRRG